MINFFKKLFEAIKQVCNVSSLCKKARQKLHALAEVVNFMDLVKRKSLMKAYITSQFNYCPLIWMFHSTQLNNRINKIQE